MHAKEKRISVQKTLHSRKCQLFSLFTRRRFSRATAQIKLILQKEDFKAQSLLTELPAGLHTNFELRLTRKMVGSASFSPPANIFEPCF